MRELCIPLPFLEEQQVAEVEVKIGDKKQKFDFRLESFPWGTGKNTDEEGINLMESGLRIDSLKKSIESYDKSWEIIQIFTPEPGAHHIQVLFRKKSVT